MTALELNGIPIPIFGDSFSEEIDDSGDVFNRSTSGAMFGSLGQRKRRWRFRTTPLPWDVAKLLTLFIEGNALSWTFASNLLSGAGVANTLSGTISNTTVGGQPCIEVLAGDGFYVDMRNKVNVPGGWAVADGWTLIFESYHTAVNDGITDGWYRHIVTSPFNVSVVAGASANPANVTQYRDGVAGSYNLGRIINVENAGNHVGLYGNNLLGGGTNGRYRNFAFLPFAIPTTAIKPWAPSTWASLINAELIKGLWSPAPIMRATGHHITVFGGGASVNVLCRVNGASHINATIDGYGSRPDVRNLDVIMEEV